MSDDIAKTAATQDERMTDTASPTTVAFRGLPADIQAASLDAVGQLPRPMSHMEMLLAVGQAILAERERDNNGWRRIETAPKNWTDVLLYDPGYRSDHISGNVFQGYFEAEMEIWCDASAEPVSPTHWQPLPTAPEGGEQP